MSIDNQEFKGNLTKWFPIRLEHISEKRVDLTKAQFASWLFLIARYWPDGYLPDDDAQLAKIAGMTTPLFRKNKHLLLKDFTKIDDKFKNKYFDREREKAMSKSHQARDAAASRRDRRPTNAGKNVYGRTTNTLQNITRNNTTKIILPEGGSDLDPRPKKGLEADDPGQPLDVPELKYTAQEPEQSVGSFAPSKTKKPVGGSA